MADNPNNPPPAEEPHTPIRSFNLMQVREDSQVQEDTCVRDSKNMNTNYSCDATTLPSTTGQVSDLGALSSTADIEAASTAVGQEGAELRDEDEELDRVDESEKPRFIFSVDAFARKAWLEKWKISVGHLQRVDSVDQCKALPDCTGIVGHLKDIVDPTAEASKSAVLNRAVSMKLHKSGGCSGIWDIDFDLLLKATSVQTNNACNDFPLDLVSGLHISKLILSMIEAWEQLRETDHGLSREEVCDIEKAIKLVSSSYPARLRNGSRFDAPKSLRGLKPKDAFDLVLLAQSMASGSREANVIPKTAAQTLNGFVEIFDKLPREQRNVTSLLETFKRLTGNFGVDKTNIQYLKAILDPSKGHVSRRALDEILVHESRLKLFEKKSNLLSTSFSWPVLGVIFRHNWFRSLNSKEFDLNQKGVGMITYVNSFFEPGNPAGMDGHRMIGEESLLRDDDGRPYDHDSLREEMLSVLVEAIAKSSSTRSSRQQKMVNRRDVLQMKFTVVVWYIFKAHPSYYEAVEKIPSASAISLHRSYFSRASAVDVVFSTFAPSFAEGLQCDACNSPTFEGLNPSEVMMAPKTVMRAIATLKDEEQRKKEKLQEEEEDAQRKIKMAKIEEAERQRQAADKELEKMRLEQTNLNLSRFALIQKQAVRLATEALRESQKKCMAYKSQVESDLTDASNEMLDTKVLILDYTGSNATHNEGPTASTNVSLQASSASTPMTLLSGGWVQKAAPFMRAVLQGRPPDVIYIDLVDDRFGNGPEHARCTIPCRDRNESEMVEYFVREVLEQTGAANPQKTTILLRVQMSEQGGGLQMSSGINILGSFASKKVRENEIPVVSSNSEVVVGSAPPSPTPSSDADDAGNAVGLDSASEEDDEVSLGKRVVYRRRPYWNIGSVELSLKEQYETACREREAKHKRKSRASTGSRRSSVPSSRVIKLPGLMQETIFVIERTVKPPEGTRKPIESSIRRAFRERYYRADEQKAVIVAEKVDALSKRTSDLSVETLTDLFTTAGLQKDGTAIIMAPGSCNCNSILSAIGCIGARVVLPMKLSSLADYPQLHDKLFASIRQGIRDRNFTPCQKMPIRPVSEALSYVLGAKRQQIRLCEDREMTAEEEANFECNVLDVSRIIAPINYVTEYHFPVWREDPLEAVNTKLRNITTDDSVRTGTIDMFRQNVECGKRGQGTWLQCRGTFEVGQEIFRFDGITHCCTRTSSVVELIAAKCGLQIAEVCNPLPVAIEPTASERPSGEPRRVTSFKTREGFPPDSWNIVEVKFFMPTKSSEPDWVRATESLGGLQDTGKTTANDKSHESSPGGSSEDISTPGTPMKRERVDEFECGQLFLAGTSEDFEGHLLFKTKTDYSFAGHMTRAFSESPVRIEVDLNRSSYIRVVANMKLYKGDLIWVCRTLRPSCGRDASDSDTSAVSTPAYPTRRKNSVKRKISDRSAATSRSSDRKRKTVEGRDGKSSVVKNKANRKLNLSNVEVKAARRSVGEGNRTKVTPLKASLDVTKMGPVVDMNLSAKKRARASSKKAVDHPPAAAKPETKVGDGISKKGKNVNPLGHYTTSKEGEVIGRGELTVDDGGASTSIPSRKQKRPRSAEDDHIPRELEGFMVGDDEVEEVDLDEDESDGDYSTSESDD